MLEIVNMNSSLIIVYHLRYLFVERTVPWAYLEKSPRGTEKSEVQDIPGEVGRGGIDFGTAGHLLPPAPGPTAGLQRELADM